MEPWMQDVLAVLFGVGLVLAAGLLITFWSWIGPWLHARRAALLPLSLIIGSTAAGGFAGEPLIGLIVGILVVAFMIFGPALVNAFPAGPADYVAQDEDGDAHRRALPGWGNAEEEDRAEAEARPEARPGPSAADINRLLEEAREQAAARALGTLLGAGIVPEGGRSRGMEALFGPAGRKHTRVRPWVAEAEGAARAAQPEAEAEPEAVRLIGVNAGSLNERKIAL